MKSPRVCIFFIQTSCDGKSTRRKILQPYLETIGMVCILLTSLLRINYLHFWGKAYYKTQNNNVTDSDLSEIKLLKGTAT